MQNTSVLIADQICPLCCIPIYQLSTHSSRERGQQASQITTGAVIHIPPAEFTSPLIFIDLTDGRLLQPDLRLDILDTRLNALSHDWRN